MSMFDMLKQAGSAMAVRQVFGEPYERDGVTIIPVARVMGGGGAGAGNNRDDGEHGGGEGGGFGMAAAPAGVYVIRDGQVRWEPALDINRIVLGGQIVAIALLLMARPLIQAWLKRRTA
ncbi:MAG TPA: spore germination protein GerW family protein [Herpetosiphonaceae bacterium]